ncbi:MAG: sulfotransferase [Actinomycetota bacterium]|nr:sulfotransferase [Actinomycetota bacterium]
MKKFFIVMGMPRSGTTAVRTSLASHPDLKCEYELFNEGNYNDGKPWKKEQVADTIAHLKTVDGLHHNYDLPRLEHRKLVWNSLKEMTTHVILVDRPNGLDIFLSMFFAKEYGHWHDWVGNKYNKNKKQIPSVVEINPERLKKFLSTWIPKYLAMHEEVKDFKNHIIVNYENFSRYTGRELRRIQEYLDVPFRRIVPQTRKFNRQTKITNIEELREVYSRHTNDTKLVS